MVNIKRIWLQIATAIGANSYLQGFINGSIYRGNLKKICVPGLNCYSCPGALGACPLGALQAVISDIKFGFSFYVIGFLMLIGVTLGRFVCGWLCPFGLFQDLLYKIPSLKIQITPRFQSLHYLKYLILLVFVFLLPMLWVNEFGMGDPTFCKYICPAGTLEAGFPLLFLNEDLRSAVGYLLLWKSLLLVLTILLAIVIFRPFCRFICPLGAIYSLFHSISMYQLKLDTAKCTQCGICSKTCKSALKPYKNPNHPDCIRCRECVASCPQKALTTTIMLFHR